MTDLLDPNVLIALVVVGHVHHEAAEDWLEASDQPFATCPSTQSALVRLMVRLGHLAHTAHAVLEAIAQDPRHEFWPDDVPFDEVPLTGVVGHPQVTDAYLAHQARRRGGRLITFDPGLAKAHADVAVLVATG
ncbi:VapC toxin family PIN domain ribonuclease [Actinophytocola xinjiangensis]|uniref:Ribonuclease VapC n=1 Tax=Actinophytocola xinjiangensis TaxID=485602 RepID=A0A7Z1AT93_9PSEU|nr:TA system VapC family ribonuclease toxin [Actinophytocola xinjiangensis]OLF04550.1 VapC toxin family PIN domain ribonuclease [Actinophytocola xinjiangensis]